LKKSIIITSCLGVLFALVYTLRNQEDYTNKSKENVGYAEQFRQMKQNEDGIIPSGLIGLWSQEQRFLSKANSFFGPFSEHALTTVGGRTRTVKFDLGNPKKLWAGGVSGGLWTSDDIGLTWKNIDDNISSLAVTCFSQNPFNHDVMYYGTGEGAGNSAGINGDGVFKSTDGGKTFKQLSSTSAALMGDIWDIKCSVLDSNTLYVATAGVGLFRSTDGGESFEKVLITSNSIFRIKILDDGTMYLPIQSKGIHKGHENDLNFEQLDKGIITTGFFRCDVDFCMNADSVLYATFFTSDHENLRGMFKSTNSGASWTELRNPDNESNSNFSQGWYNSLLAVSPIDPNIVIVAGVNGKFSVNGGSTWSSLANSHSDYHIAEFFPNSNSCMIGNDGGIYQYNYAGISRSYSYVERNVGYNVTQYYAGTYYPESDNFIGGTQDNGTWSGTNDNKGVIKIYGGDGSFCQIDDLGERLYYSWQNAKLLRRTLSNGANRDLYSALSIATGVNDFWFINPFDINRLDGSQIYFPTKNYIARSLDAGNSFQLITNRIIGNAYAVAVSEDEDPTVYFGGQSGIFYRIDQAATTSVGNEVKLGSLAPIEARSGFIACIEIDPSDKGTVYLGMSNYSTNPSIWRVDYADTDTPTWVNIASNLPELLPVNWIEVDPRNSNNIIAATDFGLYTSINGGGWWEKVAEIPNVSIHNIKLRASDRKLFVYTHGRGVWTADLKDEIVHVKKKETDDIKVYPNPTVSVLKTSTIGDFDYEIYNFNGQKIQSGKDARGVINVEALSPGNYILEMRNVSGTIRSKFVKN
jgi:photosystem II stability/assembly factor-like uncharacterized protein